jgi:exopolyphosphatase/pppGpp-phosphohydrolase
MEHAMSRIGTVGLAGKEAAVRDWVRRKLGAVDHEQRVARIAETLFSLTTPWHNLGGAERRMLVLGALAHDVGRAIEDEGHERHGARMLLENTSLPLGETERRRIAFLVRHHKGRVPDKGDESVLDPRLDGDDRDVFRILLGLLRAADALDSRWMVPPRLVLSIHGRELRIQGFVRSKLEAALGRPKKMRLMAETLRCAVNVEWHSMDAVALVA